MVFLGGQKLARDLGSVISDAQRDDRWNLVNVSNSDEILPVSLERGHNGVGVCSSDASRKRRFIP